MELIDHGGNRGTSVPLFLDLETFCELDLRKAGAYAYAAHPSLEVLLTSYAWGDGPVQVCEGLPPIPDGTTVISWGAFDRVVLRALGHQIKHTDAAVVSAENGWPLKLETAARAARVKTRKDPAGKRLIKLFCSPGKKKGRVMPEDRPEEWQHFRSYCSDDTVAMREIYRLCAPVQPQERLIIELDQKINDRGVAADLEAVATLATLRDETMRQVNAALAGATGGKITSVTQSQRIAKYLGVKSLAKEHLPGILAAEKDPQKRLALRCRVIGSKMSGAKLDAFTATVSPDGRLRGTLQICGAHTRRWAGRGVQPQNMPRDCYSEKEVEGLLEVAPDGPRVVQEAMGVAPTVAVSKALRGLLVAPPGKVLCVADYSAIEARVLAWLAGQSDVLEIYRSGGDVYKDMASSVYRVPVDEVTSEQRFMGKTLVLGCGYMMGRDRLQESLALKDVRVSDDEAQELVNAFRGRYDAVTLLWERIKEAMFAVVRDPGKVAVYRRAPGEKPLLAFRVRDGVLQVLLPGGSVLRYHRPRIERVPAPWDPNQKIPAVTAEHRASTGHWARRPMSPGLTTENIVQSIARECMGDGMLRVDRASFNLILTVHDELISEEPEDNPRLGEYKRLLRVPPRWAPDLPLEVEAGVMRRYGK